MGFNQTSHQCPAKRSSFLISCQQKGTSITNVYSTSHATPHFKKNIHTFIPQTNNVFLCSLQKKSTHHLAFTTPVGFFVISSNLKPCKVALFYCHVKSINITRHLYIVKMLHFQVLKVPLAQYSSTTGRIRLSKAWALKRKAAGSWVYTLVTREGRVGWGCGG